MEITKTFENYPFWFVFLANALAFSIYGIGAYIFYGFGILAAFAYLLYCLIIELRLLKKSCIDCYYYGKTCFSGRGRICALIHKKGDPARFLKTQIKFKDLIPDMLVGLAPVLAGIILLILAFSWPLLGLTIFLFILSFFGNALLRGSLACKFCKQRELGCPAAEFFNQK